jgi:hypothetical protein
MYEMAAHRPAFKAFVSLKINSCILTYFIGMTFVVPDIV